MPKDSTKYHFAAMPLRALGDHELTGADFRVLGIISYFDRFGRNGSGCYATQAHMAEWTGLAIPTISAAVKKLCVLGYLEKAPQQNRRRHQYRVIHEAAGRNTSPTDEVSSSNSSATGEVSAPDTSATGETKRSCKTGERDSAEAASSENDVPLKYIPPESGALASQNAPPPFCFMPADNDGEGELRAKAARLERFINSSSECLFVSTDDLEVAQELYERIQECSDDLQAMGHVERVMSEIELLVDDDAA